VLGVRVEIELKSDWLLYFTSSTSGILPEAEEVIFFKVLHLIDE